MKFCGKWLVHLVFLTLMYIPVFVIGYYNFSNTILLNGEEHFSLESAIMKFTADGCSYSTRPLECYLLFCVLSNVITIFLVFILPNFGFPCENVMF